MKKRYLRITALMLAATITASSSLTCLAAGTPSSKEEVIYVVLDNAGKQQSIQVVNIFQGGTVLDYGSYESVKNLSTTDAITQSGDSYTISSGASQIYYQGTMKETTALPWNISLTYYLDGKELSAEDLAGKSGDLSIHFVITENTACSKAFYDHYALQASFSLDSKKCSDISASDATIANVGTKKQLTYTILPGQGIDTTISAHVTAFEMDEVDLNGISMNMDVNVDDEELMDMVQELMDGTRDLNDGASSLDDGVSELQDGVSTIWDGLNELNSKSGELTDSSASVLNGLHTIQSALTAVSMSTDDLAALANASASIRDAISGLSDAVASMQQQIGYSQYKTVMQNNGLDIDALKAANTQSAASLEAQITQLSQTLSQIQDVPGYEDTASQLQAQIAQLQQTLQLISANLGALEGTEGYLTQTSGALSELSANVAKLNDTYREFDAKIQELVTSLKAMTVNMSELASGINELISGYEQLDSGINEYTDAVASIVAGYSELTDGVGSLASGSRELSDGTAELYDRTSTMDTDVQDEIDSLTDLLTGGSSEITSFVSDKNTNVTSVQFVIRTSSISIPDEDEETVATEENPSFWQKLMDLFHRN